MKALQDETLERAKLQSESLFEFKNDIETMNGNSISALTEMVRKTYISDLFDDFRECFAPLSHESENPLR